MILALKLAGCLGFQQNNCRLFGRSAPKLLQTGARHWWKQRWQSMLAVAAQTAFAESLTADVMGAPPCIDGEAPSLGELAV